MSYWLGTRYRSQICELWPFRTHPQVFEMFFGVLQDVISGDSLVWADVSVYHFLQSVRSPWGDTVMLNLATPGHWRRGACSDLGVRCRFYCRVAEAGSATIALVHASPHSDDCVRQCGAAA